MQVCLIEVPYMVGDERQGFSKGPTRYVEAGADKRLNAKGITTTVAKVERKKPFRDSASASLAVNKEVASLVARTLAAGQFPLVLAGSCDVSMGILAGFEHDNCGVVWFDAHADSNTPETTISGFYAGMPVAVITGSCYQQLWAQMGNSTPIAEAATLMLGLRDVDPLEQERLDHSAIRVIPWHEGKPQGDVLAALDELATRVPEIYLHLDFDSFDPQVAPALGEYGAAGGLSMQDAEDAIRAIAVRFRIKAAAITVYNVDLDQDEKHLKLGLHMIEVLAECATGG